MNNNVIDTGSGETLVDKKCHMYVVLYDFPYSSYIVFRLLWFLNISVTSYICGLNQSMRNKPPIAILW